MSKDKKIKLLIEEIKEWKADYKELANEYNKLELKK